MHLFWLIVYFKLYLLKDSLAEVHRNNFSCAVLKVFNKSDIILATVSLHFGYFFLLATLVMISVSGVLKFDDDMFTIHPFSVHYDRHLISLCNLGIYVWGKFSYIISLANFYFSLFILSLFLLSYWCDTIFPALPTLVVWYLLSCLPTFCLFHSIFKKKISKL